jgi:hypothetical protein
MSAITHPGIVDNICPLTAPMIKSSWPISDVKVINGIFNLKRKNKSFILWLSPIF